MSSRPSEPPNPDLFSARDDEGEDEFDYGSDRDRLRGGLGVSDFVRRAIKDTVGSVQSTSTLSKEALTYLIQQGEKGRREALRIFANEVGNFLRDTDLSTEVIKILTGVQVEFNANIKFKPSGNDGGVRVSTDSDFDLNVTTGSEPPPPRGSTPPPGVEEDDREPPPRAVSEPPPDDT